MKCPLLSAASVSCDARPARGEGDCIKEECAWWLEDVRLCSIRMIAREISTTKLRLGDINDRLRSEEVK